MYLSALAFAVAGVVFGLALLAVGSRLSRRLDTDPARRPFESGAHPAVHAWNRFHPRYLNYALVFLLAQLLLPFVFAWVVVARDSGGRGIVVMGVFLLLVVAGLLYAARERAFEWD